MRKKIQTAIVGYGLSGQAFHAPFLHVHDGFQLNKVVERNRTDSKKAYPYVEVVKNLGFILDDPEIDMVVICTPNVYHYEQTKKCLEAGKHVVIEKPFMPTAKECDEIIELAESKGLQLFVYHNRRWDGDFQTIQKVYRSGVLGDIQYFEAHFDRWAPERTRATWRDEDNPGSGVLFDLGPHLIDQALTLFGNPDYLMADIQSQRKGSMVDDYFKINLFYPETEVVLTAGVMVKDHELR